MAGKVLTILVDGSPLRDGRRTAGIGRYTERMLDALAQLEGLRVIVTRPPRPPRQTWALRYLTAQPSVVSAAIRQRPDVAHGMASDPLIGLPLGKQVVTLHDVVPWTTAPVSPISLTAPYLAIQARRLRHCAAIIADSRSVAEAAETALGIRPDRIHVVPLGVSQSFNPRAGMDDGRLRSAAGVATDRYVFWVGSLQAHDPRKALDTVVEALTGLNPNEVQLVLAGAEGEESRRVQGLAMKRGVATIFTGYVPDGTLAALYRGATMLVLPSLDEGFGLTALEAMACGTPLVASNRGNLPDLVDGAALLVRPGDAAELRQAVTSLLDSEAARSRLSGHGPRLAAAYTWRRAAEATTDVYREVASWQH